MIDPKDLMAGGNQPTPDDPSQAPDAATGGDAVPHDMQSQMAAARAKLGIPAPAPQNADGSTTAAAPEQSTPPIVDATPAPKQGLVSKFAAGANEAAKQNPQPNAPGAWAKNLLGGIVSSLGDASHATDNLKPGQGGLSGVLNTLAARSSRQAGEKQQQFKNNIETTEQARKQKETDVMAAETLARTYNYGLQSNKLAQEIDENAVKLRQTRNNDGKLAVEPYRKWHDVQDGISQNDLQTRMATYMKNPDVGADGKAIPFATQFHVFQTGDEEIQGPDGGKHVVPTYSVVKSGEQQVEITDKLHDLLAKNLPKGDVPPVGTKIDGHLYDNQITQALQVNAAYEAMEAGGVKRGEMEDSQNFRQAMQVAGHFMADNVSDPFEGLQGGLDQAKTKIAQDTQALALAQKAGDQNAIQKAQSMLTQASTEKSAIETIVNSPAMEKQRAQYNEKLTAQREKAAEKAQTKALSDADTDTLIEAAKNYQLDPQKMEGIRDQSRAKFMAAMLRQDPNWSEAEYKERYSTQQDFRPSGEAGKAVRSLNAFTGHIGDANDLISTIGNTNSKFLNTPLNKLSTQFTGNTVIGPYKAALRAAGTEYETYLNNQHALTNNDKEDIKQLLDDATPPAAAQAIMRQMAQTIAIKGRSLNGGYKAVFGKDYPSMLLPESAQIMRNFGINPDQIGGTQGQQPGQQQPQKQQQPQVLDKPPVDGAIRMKDPKTGNIHWISPDKIEAAKKYGGIEVK